MEAASVETHYVTRAACMRRLQRLSRELVWATDEKDASEERASQQFVYDLRTQNKSHALKMSRLRINV